MGIAKGCVRESEKDDFCNNTYTYSNEMGKNCAINAGGIPNPKYCYVCGWDECNGKNPTKPVGNMKFCKIKMQGFALRKN